MHDSNVGYKLDDIEEALAQLEHNWLVDALIVKELQKLWLPKTHIWLIYAQRKVLGMMTAPRSRGLTTQKSSLSKNLTWWSFHLRTYLWHLFHCMTNFCHPLHWIKMWWPIVLETGRIPKYPSLHSWEYICHRHWVIRLMSGPQDWWAHANSEAANCSNIIFSHLTITTVIVSSLVMTNVYRQSLCVVTVVAPSAESSIVIQLSPTGMPARCLFNNRTRLSKVVNYRRSATMKCVRERANAERPYLSGKQTVEHGTIWHGSGDQIMGQRQPLVQQISMYYHPAPIYQ